MRHAASLGALLLVALVHAEAAATHVIVAPQFLYADERTTVRFSGPNERDEPMTGFSIAVPERFRIVGAEPMSRWQARVGAREVRWTGGSLAAGASIAFTIEVESPSAPGTASLVTRQLYPGGEEVEWRLTLTITPPRDEPPQHVWRALLAALVGLLVTVVLVGFAWRRRTGTL